MKKLIKHAATIGFPLFIFGGFSFLYFALLIYPDFQHQYIANGSDSIGAMWALNWWTFALHHHLNLFYTYYLWSPYGYNLAQTQAMPLLGFILSPLIAKIGIIATFNLITIFASTLSAYTAFWLCRYLTKSFSAGLFGGFLFGFSSYQITQMLSHLCLIVTFLIPLIALISILFFQNKIKPVLFVFLYSVLLACEFYINQETGFLIILFSLFALLLSFYLFDDNRSFVVEKSRHWFMALLFTALLISPIIYYFFGTPKGDYFKNTTDNSLAILNYIIPTKATFLGGNILTLIHKNFPANLYESGGYLGMPLLLICYLYSKKAWQEKEGRWFVCFTLLCALFALGPFLHFFQGSMKIPMPWILFNYLPITNEILPARIMLLVSLCVSMMAAIWFSTTEMKSYIKCGISILSILFIFPNILNQKQMWVQKESVPHYFQSGDYKKRITEGDTILAISNDCHDMFWQTQSQMWFSIHDGCTGGTPPEATPNSVIKRLQLHQFDQITRDQFQQYQKLSHFQLIIVSPNLYPLWNPFLTRMGYVLKEKEGVYIGTQR